MNMHRKALTLVALVALGAPQAWAQETWEGTGRWGSGSTVTVFLDGLSGDAAKSFKEGITGWSSHLSGITVKFADGYSPTPTDPGTVQVQPVPEDSPKLKITDKDGNPQTVSSVTEMKGSGNTFSYGTIYIDQTSFSDSSMMSNLGYHEFGHVLGLGDLPEQTPRSRVMDPGFDQDSPVIAPSAADWKTLSQRYTVSNVPEPESYALMLAGLNVLFLATRRRQARQGG